jgi:peptidoglycan/LPS O-acetylase OafA/YrhL
MERYSSLAGVTSLVGFACAHGRVKAEGMKKEIPLEAIRGIGALVVIVWHVCYGFFPHAIGVYSGFAAQNWQGSPLFVFMNGPAAVALFFVLSGFVLTRRYFEFGNNRTLLKGAVKRWPRLMGPVLLVVLASYVLFKLDLYWFEQAGAVSGSPWLMTFALAYNVKPPIEFWDAVRQGTFLTFFRGDFYYDSNLWTMHPEFIGSFMAFGLAPILLAARKLSMLLTISLVGMASVLADYAILNQTSLIAFPIGVGIAALVSRDLAMPRGIAYMALLMALYLLGFSGADLGIYAVLYHPIFVTHSYEVNVIGAGILITVIETSPAIRKIFSGPISQFLGDLSFPIYLVHVLIICSAGSAIYLWAGAAPAVLAVLILSVLISLPLIAFNKWWIKHLNAAIGCMIREQPADPSQHPASLPKFRF